MVLLMMLAYLPAVVLAVTAGLLWNEAHAVREGTFEERHMLMLVHVVRTTPEFFSLLIAACVLLSWAVALNLMLLKKRT